MKSYSPIPLGILCVAVIEVSAQTNVFSSTGNAGAGTTTPAALLEVYGDGSDSQDLFRVTRGGGNAARLQFGHSYIQRYDGNGNPGPILLNVNGGNVGIGTMTPVQKLEVSGGYARISYASGPFLDFYHASAGTDLKTTRIGSLDGALLFESVNDIYTVPVERMRIAANGRVGIGTANPATKLDVNGAGHVRLDPDDGSIELFSGNDGASYIDFRGASYPTADYRGRILYTDGSGLHSGFHFSVAGTYNTAFFIGESGNVGIGTANPAHKLAVNGTIKAKEVIVETIGWSDYVFAADYRLAPLSEVEQHIQQNGHLPDVPSAADVAARGVSVGEMQKILLQKIEELTLHAIEQRKLLESQQAEIARLRAQVSQLSPR